MQTLALDPRCAALLLSAKTANVFVTFDNSTPAATNGLEIVAGSQPVLVPLGYYAHVNHSLKIIGAAINAVLNVVQMA